MSFKVFGERAIIESIQTFGKPAACQELEAALRRFGILSSKEKLLNYEEEREFVRVDSDSFGAVFRVEASDPRGRTRRTWVYAKAIVTGFGEEGTAIAVRSQLEKLRLLSTWGIRTPRVYGSGKGTIYQDYIEGTEPVPSRAPDELARMAAVLDFHGVRPIGFLHHFIDRGGELYCVDAGCDLGAISESRPPNSDRPSLKALLAECQGALRGRVETSYERERARLGRPT
jgi:hypothetical protein